jgi:hypothetical protein
VQRDMHAEVLQVRRCQCWWWCLVVVRVLHARLYTAPGCIQCCTYSTCAQILSRPAINTPSAWRAHPSHGTPSWWPQGLSALQASRARLREAWQSWNPQRAAAQALQQQVAAGATTLQAAEDARRRAFAPAPAAAPRAHAGAMPDGAAAALGWAAHPRPFAWPAPKAPHEYQQHPLQPSGYRCGVCARASERVCVCVRVSCTVQHVGVGQRLKPRTATLPCINTCNSTRIEELREPWQEPAAVAAAAASGCSAQQPGDSSHPRQPPAFGAIVRAPPNGLFTQDAAFWQTVHLGGDGWEDERAAAAAAAKAAWAARLVVADAAFHGLRGSGDKAPAQVRGASAAARGTRARRWHSRAGPTHMCVCVSSHTG